jgi:outer membrane protein assembly factor BamD (BamD/ComL family)
MSSRNLLLVAAVLLFTFELQAQSTITDDLKKPKKYENKKLGYEKTAEKKFTVPRRFIQNTVTHYNWHFNASNKLDQVIERAKAAHKDDYAELLTFYNYSLDKTSADSRELDSVILKANTGILIHDLRNAWIDNLFLLMGKAYLLKKEFDSAYLTFQYVNYAFSPKEADGYDKPIGSNANEEGNAFTIATKEKSGVLHKALTTPPSRNESFILQIRTYLEREEYAEAGGLIQTLRNDPQFPARLHGNLDEMQAYLFYKQSQYDSAAVYLDRALVVAESKQESSRWEYLIGQLYEKAGKAGLSQQFYNRAIRHTLDPVLEVYARLNSIRQNRADSVAVQKAVDELLRMARKDRYTSYRHIIFYTAAQIELERKQLPAAKQLLWKSATSATELMQIEDRSKAFMLLGDLAFADREYQEAKSYYDSININDPGIKDPAALDKRKLVLNRIVEQLDVIDREDSLQRIAAMSESERTTLLKKMLRKLRKAQGLKEEEEKEQPAQNGPQTVDNNRAGPTDLFASAPKGEWYFGNASLKSKGFTAFKTTWGNRPNVDNWRRQAAVSMAGAGQNPGVQSGSATDNNSQDSELSYEGLLKEIPLTPDQLAASNDRIENASVSLGIVYVDALEDYYGAIPIFDNHLVKFPYSNRRAESLYYLYYCYRKIGNTAAMEPLARELKEKYAGSKFDKQISSSVEGSETAQRNNAVTSSYEAIYNLFIEGSFEQALALKKETDSLYGTSYWTPQLLYIESVYHIRQRDDTTARRVLDKLIQSFPESPMAVKARNLIDVLSRRKEIEDYLTKLQIERPSDDSIAIVYAATRPAVTRTIIQRDSVVNDSTLKDEVVKNAQPQRQQENPQPQQDVGRMQPRPRDTVSTQPTNDQKKNTQPAVPGAYNFNAANAHFVAIVLTKVDPVYVTETRNAFNRYNQEKFYNQPIEITNQILDDTVRLVIMNGFSNAAVAMEYLEKTRPISQTHIVPWLPAGKYYFIVIDEPNILLLQEKKSLTEYLRFLKVNFPDKF